MNKKIFFLLYFFLLLFSVHGFAQAIEVRVDDGRVEGPQKFVYVFDDAADKEWQNAFWHPQNGFPVNNYTINLSRDKIGEPGNLVIISPASIDKHWIIRATPLKFAFPSTIKIEVFTNDSPELNGSAKKCYEKDLELTGTLELTNRWPKVVADSCGVVFRVNFVTLTGYALKIKDFGFQANPSVLGRIPVKGEVIFYTRDLKETQIEKPSSVNQNLELNASIVSYKDGENYSFRQPLTLKYRVVNPWNVAGSEQVQFLSTQGEFLIDMAKENPLILLEVGGSAWTFKAEKVSQSVTGATKRVKISVWKNATASGAKCLEKEFTFNSNIYKVSGLTVPLGPWVPFYAPECGIVFQAKTEIHTDILRFRELGPTFLEIEKNPGLKRAAVTKQAVETIKQVKKEDETQLQADKTQTERTKELFEARGGVIEKYYVRFSSDALNNIGKILKLFFKKGVLGLLGIGDEFNEINVYRAITKNMHIQDSTGRSLVRLSSVPLLGCRKPCFYLNPTIKMEKNILPDGTKTAPDLKAKPAIVLSQIKPGIYYVTYSFPNMPLIKMQWGIEFDPEKPIRERFLGIGENVPA